MNKTHLLPTTPQGHLNKMNEVGRAQLAQGDQGVGAGLNCFVQYLLGKPGQKFISSMSLKEVTAGSTDSGTAGATMVIDWPPRW